MLQLVSRAFLVLGLVLSILLHQSDYAVVVAAVLCGSSQRLQHEMARALREVGTTPLRFTASIYTVGRTHTRTITVCYVLCVHYNGMDCADHFFPIVSFLLQIFFKRVCSLTQLIFQKVFGRVQGMLGLGSVAELTELLCGCHITHRTAL